MEKLNSMWQAASEEMYKNTQGQTGAEGQPGADPNAGQQKGGGGKDDEVTDVDFEEVKDDK